MTDLVEVAALLGSVDSDGFFGSLFDLCQLLLELYFGSGSMELVLSLLLLQDLHFLLVFGTIFVVRNARFVVRYVAVAHFAVVLRLANPILRHDGTANLTTESLPVKWWSK